MKIPKIVLDATEEKIRQTLVSFAEVYSRELGQPVTLRITGGWVRDKLLGRPSHDIDVAIDATSGEQFATSLQTWLAASGDASRSVHKIARNPDKSKHLETATTKLFDLDIDFVNLRSETYTATSRIPQIALGTPREDALRRDATLNALFYNLHAQEIEDWTGRGYTDLLAGVLRTPLDPLETFRDDPLRVLRLVRFAAQLNFRIDDAALAAMGSPAVRGELRAKVSRERVGTEFGKTIAGAHAIVGLRYLHTLGLVPTVLSLPPPYTIAEGIAGAPAGAEELPYATVGEQLETADRVLPELAFFAEPAQRQDYWLGVLLADWAGVRARDAKKKQTAAPLAVAKFGLSLAKTLSSVVPRVVDHVDEVWQLAAEVAAAEPAVDAAAERLAAGRIARLLGDDQALGFALAAAKYNAPARANAVHARIAELGLADAHKVRALIDGRALAALLDRKPGPWLAAADARMVEHQLVHPGVTRDEMQAFAETNFRE